MLIKLTMLLGSAICFVQAAFAGVCLEYPPAVVEFSRSEAVFIGKVLSVRRFRGIKRTQENWNLKHRIVEFEVQKAYKGIEAGKIVQAVNAYGDIDWEDLKLKKGQQWEIFVWQNDGRWFFGSGCVPWSEKIDGRTDFMRADERLSSLKEKVESDRQAITGRVAGDVGKIKNLEAVIKSDGRISVVTVDDEGRFYLPVDRGGAYEIEIAVPADTQLMYSSQKVAVRHSEAPKKEAVFFYRIELRRGEFYYNELTLQ